MSRSTVRARAGQRIVAAALVALTTWLAPSGAAARPSLSELYSPPHLQQLVLDPSGEYLAMVVTERGRDRVLVRRRDDGREVLASRRAGAIGRVAWIDDQRLVIARGLGAQPIYDVVTVSSNEDGLATREERIRVRGSFVSLLPSMGDEVLWAFKGPSGASVYRLRIELLLGEGDRTFEEPDRELRVAHLKRGVDWWVADRRGTVRAALRIDRRRKSELWYRASAEDEWRLLADADDPDEIPRPYGIAENDRDLVVASKAGRDTWALFDLSAETGELGRERFAHPDADVSGVIHDYSGAVIGAVYERAGLEEFHHFDAFRARYQRSLEHALPDVVVDMVSASRDRRHIVVVSKSPRDPGTYYLLDTQTNIATEVGRMMPWLDPDELADVVALRVASTGEAELDVFFARPESGGRKPPLVVMPHGGPIGIRDTRSFDPLVQYLAMGGLAVLQVNYRGSGGRGEAFLDSGKREWGKGIEEDLEAAIDAVLERGWVDPERICVAGGSYGGYSALVSVIRSPGRYRCAASFNGPTDLPFLYHSNLSRIYTEEGRESFTEWFTEFVGDPEEDYERLISISPAYRASEIRVPILLVQGTEDRRVDVDHFYRMQTVLEALGKPHEAHLFQGGGHSLSATEWPELAHRLRTFLLRHLDPS